ncbi:carbohydrate ABC transporter permease [Planosporangium sp. 12N6]|uniref:carbohydrate ABC transporter permease n=1 Tax=Planosporangium spinosum TaxID=3402278 RepID=UPI003CEF761F
MSRTETALGLQARGGPAAGVAKIALYTLLVVVFAGPLVALLVSSFTTVSDPSRFTIWPDRPTLRNYDVAIGRGALLFLFNSFVVVGGGLLLQVFVTVLAGYALARRTFRGATLVLLLILSTMMLPEEILAIPLSLVLGDLPVVHVSILNTLWGMIIPVGAWAVSIVVMTEFMKEIPAELEEAARIDGAGEFRVFWSVILPLCQPALGVVGILGFSMIWDQYILPLLVAQDSHQYTLSLALRTLRSDDQAGLGVLLAAAVLALLPSVIVFLSFQRQFMKGLTSGAVKG